MPTDAGRIVRGILDMRVGAYRSKKMLSGFSKWIAILGLIAGIYWLNLLLILFAIYALITGKTEDWLPVKNLQTRFSNSADPMDFSLGPGHFS
jgi:hypothetical protein